MENIFEGLDLSPWKTGWEPGGPVFDGYEGEVENIEKKYDPSQRQGETVFYGASNFRMWKNMDKDLSEFKAQNHGFGGATDVLLIHYAPRLLFAYKPKTAVIQSGSNDLAGLKGRPAKQAAASLELKKRMYEYFCKALPDTKFIVLSAILMPGAPFWTETSVLVNEGLRDLCGQEPQLEYLGIDSLTFDGSVYKNELFKSDGIHLNRDGQLLLCNDHIRPALEKLSSK